MRVMQNPYYLPLATIPAAWILCYVPHAVAVTSKVLVTGPLHYNNDTPRSGKSSAI